jgi:glucosamine-6-phosphate deaminase
LAFQSWFVTRSATFEDETMEIIIQSDTVAAVQYAARFMAATIRRTPRAVLGLATGGTPEGVYAELVRMHREEGLDFSGVETFNLDEYVGLPPEHKSSYRYYMASRLFNPVKIPSSATHFPDGMAADLPAECLQYERQIKSAGGIGLQLLGIGRDGHIGFNEPTSSLASRTRIKTLTEETIRDNTKYFKKGEKVPFHVLTMGIGTIREARTVLMVALGETKAEAVAQMVEGPVTSMVPASALQMHEKTVVILDGAAAARLSKADYYRWVFDNKPAWQHVVPRGGSMRR